MSTPSPAGGSGTPFGGLSPDRVLRAAEAVGLEPDGRLFALNSYENRVYRLGRCDDEPLVMKFYRGGRWSDEQILEEHAFELELAAQELPVVAPLAFAGSTLVHFEGFRWAAFPMRAGHAPDLDTPEARLMLGRTLGRVHAIGALRPFRYRPRLQGDWLGTRARTQVLSSTLLPEAAKPRFSAASAQLCDAIDVTWQESAPLAQIRLHGDCHLGNILWRPEGPLFVDLDDCLMGPRIQDLWMFLSGTGDEQRRQWAELAEGYQQFSNLDLVELRVVEALRAARMLNHAAWVADRWRDPAFPLAFPWFGQERFWDQYTQDLIEQYERLGEPSVLAG